MIEAYRDGRDGGGHRVDRQPRRRHGRVPGRRAGDRVRAPGAARAKLELIERHGAEIRLTGADFDQAKSAAAALLRTRGCRCSRTAPSGSSTTATGRSQPRSWPSSSRRPQRSSSRSGTARSSAASASSCRHAPATRRIGVQSAQASVMVECWRAGDIVTSTEPTPSPTASRFGSPFLWPSRCSARSSRGWSSSRAGNRRGRRCLRAGRHPRRAPRSGAGSARRGPRRRGADRPRRDRPQHRRRPLAPRLRRAVVLPRLKHPGDPSGISRTGREGRERRRPSLDCAEGVPTTPQGERERPRPASFPSDSPLRRSPTSSARLRSDSLPRFARPRPGSDPVGRKLLGADWGWQVGCLLGSRQRPWTLARAQATDQVSPAFRSASRSPSPSFARAAASWWSIASP